MASRKLFQSVYEWGSAHVSEMLAVGAAGGCTLTAAMYARGRQRALDQARRNWSSKAATEAGAEAGTARQAVAAAGQAAVKKAPKYSYSTTEKFALALWHG